MHERTEVVQTADGRMDLYIACPDGPGPHPGVVMYHNVGGASPLVQQLARRVAAEGYYCAMPDLYYRLGKVIIDPDSKTPPVLAIRKTLLDSLSDAGVLADTGATLAFMDADPAVAKGPRGTVGFCMGGRFVVQAGAAFPAVLQANASLFGTRMVTDAADSPHKLLDRLAGEAYFGMAEHDHLFPLPQVDQFMALVRSQCRAKWTHDLHAGAHHGYSFPGRPVYQEAAAELSWKRIFDMYGRILKGARA